MFAKYFNHILVTSIDVGQSVRHDEISTTAVMVAAWLPVEETTMSLNWDISKVKDFEQLKDGNGRLDVVAETIIWSTIVVGIGEITAKNAEEFTIRLRMMETIDGTGMVPVMDGNDVHEYRRVTLADVERMIGLSTNVFPMDSASKFEKRVMANLRRMETRQVRNQKVAADQAEAAAGHAAAMQAADDAACYAEEVHNG